MKETYAYQANGGKHALTKYVKICLKKNVKKIGMEHARYLGHHEKTKPMND
jgi:hypothetical protein